MTSAPREAGQEIQDGSEAEPSARFLGGVRRSFTARRRRFWNDWPRVDQGLRRPADLTPDSVQRSCAAADTPDVTIDLLPEEKSAPAPQPDDLAAAERDVDRLRKKERKRLYDAGRTLDAWECYRALNDATDEAYELIDISNREARFALILMGALNAGVAILLTRADAFASLTTGEGYFVAALFVGYVIMALIFLLQAIEALRPGHFRPHLEDWPKTEDRPAGVRYHEDVITRTPSEHWQAWQEVRLSQLNAEMAVQVHSLSLKNNAKHIALRRLYRGLRAMAIVLAILMVVFAWLVWT